jgi:hypothetical protein
MKKQYESLRTIAEWERERSRKSVAERVAWYGIVAAAAYFAAHLAYALVRS